MLVKVHALNIFKAIQGILFSQNSAQFYLFGQCAVIRNTLVILSRTVSEILKTDFFLLLMNVEQLIKIKTFEQNFIVTSYNYSMCTTKYNKIKIGRGKIFCYFYHFSFVGFSCAGSIDFLENDLR